MAHNERGAGRKPQPFKTVQKRIPEDLVPAVERMIEEYKKALKREDLK